jgi:hypothetical protein
MQHIIIDSPATIAAMEFNPLNPVSVTISGDEYAAAYTLDRAARLVTVAYYDETGAEHRAQIPADHPAYLPARHTARAFYRETGEKLPPRPERAAAAIPAEDPRNALAAFEADGHGWWIRCSVNDRRIQLHFKSRPTAAVLQAVKAAGWHWSPNAECWLLKLNTKNVAAAQLLTMKLPA